MSETSSILEVSSDRNSDVYLPVGLMHDSSSRMSSAALTPMVWLGLDSFHYTGGEKVTGEIMLNLPVDTPAGKLILRSRGYEDVKVYHKQIGKKHSRHARNIIYEYENLIHEWDNTITLGQYVFPYTFKLPHYVPSTFHFQGEDSNNNTLKAKIVYEITIDFEVVSDRTKNLRDGKRILVSSQLNNGLVNVSAENNEVISGCISNKGVTTLRLIVLNEEHAVVNGNISYRLETNNSKCSARINQVTSYVSLIVELNLEGQRYRYGRVLSHVSKEISIPPNAENIIDKEYEYTAEIRLPGDDQNPSSVETPLIYCRYSIDAILYYNLACKDITSLISLPVYINPRNYKDEENPKLPSSWDPKEHPIVNMTIEGQKVKPTQIDEQSTILRSSGMWSTSSPSLFHWNSDSMAEF